MSLKGKRVLVIGGGSGIGRAVAEGALREGANVVLASSNAEKVARAAGELVACVSSGRALTTAAAAAIEFLSRGLAVDLAPVRVNCVCPGLIQTGVWDMIPEEHREMQLLKMTERQLVPRPGQPAEAAEAYLYLMRNGYVTGQTLYVEGGSALV